MADLQEIIKTHTKSYPSYLDTYPRNGKTTVADTIFKIKGALRDQLYPKNAHLDPLDIPDTLPLKWVPGIFKKGPMEPKKIVFKIA